VTPNREERLARKLQRAAQEQERAEQIKTCVQEGWPLKEIYRTFNTSARFVKKWFPDYAGMPAQESGSLSMAIQRRKL
jgi:transposase